MRFRTALQNFFLVVFHVITSLVFCWAVTLLAFMVFGQIIGVIALVLSLIAFFAIPIMLYFLLSLHKKRWLAYSYVGLEIAICVIFLTIAIL